MPGLQVITALRQVFGGLSDPRKPRGVRHRLASVLTITVLAALCGAGNFREAGDRAADLPQDMLAAAGARIHPVTGRRQAPSDATIRRIVCDIDADHADSLVGAWLSQCVAAHRGAEGADGDGLPEGVDWLDGLALDGKTIRHSATAGSGVNVRLFAALLHEEQVVIAQVAVPQDTTETTQVANLLTEVDLTGKTVTADAAHTSADTADYLAGTRNCDYVLVVKANTPTLLDAIIAKMPRPHDGSAHHTHDQITGGRRIVRQIWVAAAVGINFPHTRQVFRIRRQVFDLSGNRLSKEYVHGITSLTAEAANPKQLLDTVRRHWRIETTHQIRDVTWREDHQHAYTGNGPQVMATLRNLALAILRLTGCHQIIRTLQHIAADRNRLLPILTRFPLPATRPFQDRAPRAQRGGADVVEHQPSCCV
jgi:predicted transposase YbfD/YdcC